MKQLTVQEIIEKFNLKLLYQNKDVNLSDRALTNPGINRGGLELTGFKQKEVSRARRAMLLSSKETEYIEFLNKQNHDEDFTNILEKHIPVIFVTVNFKFTKELCALAEKIKSEVPIIVFPGITAEFYNTIAIYIIERLALSETVHGSLTNIFGFGVLIMGESGIGKSETTLDLIRAGHLFVGDDSIDVLKVNNKLMGKPNQLVKNLIEIRGIGILNVIKMYGYHILLHETKINLIVNLVKSSSEEYANVDRLGNKMEYQEFFNIKVPQMTIPVSPGRNLADLIESAVISLKLKEEGQGAISSFEDQVINNLKGTK